VVEGRTRPAWAEIDLAAVRANVGALRGRVAPAALCAVVKAGAYGHGAVAVARAAVDAGAAGLAVALVDEGVELREAGIGAPVLVLAEAPPDAPDALEALAEAGFTATVASTAGATALAGAARRVGTRVPVHVKVDTGMHRVGVAPASAPGLVAAVAAEPALRLEGLWTHLAVADGATDDDSAFTGQQLATFDKVVAQLPVRPPVLHAANTAGAVACRGARYDMVRCGIGIYGLAPSAGMASSPAWHGLALRPAMALRARVSAVRTLDAGERPSYGRLRALRERSVVATVPLGYADGVRRALFDAGATVIVGSRRCPLAGAVTMDQLLVDCGPDAAVSPGDEVTLLGRQGGEEVTVAEWASLLGTIDYEVVCGIGARVPRVNLGAAGSGGRGGSR
jgi:alanine racemase